MNRRRDGTILHPTGTVKNQRNRDGGFQVHQQILIEGGAAGRDAMDGSQRNGKKIDPGAFGELGGLRDIGRIDLLGGGARLRHDSDLALDTGPGVVGYPDNFGGHADIFFEGQGGAIEHDRRKAQVQCLLYDFEVPPMVQVKGQRDIRLRSDRVNGGGQRCKSHVVDRLIADGQNGGRLFKLGGGDDPLYHHQVVGVEMSDGPIGTRRYLV